MSPRCHARRREPDWSDSPRVRSCSFHRGLDLGDGSNEVVSVPLQLREGLRGSRWLQARARMIEKMRLADDCGTALVGGDQKRQNRAAEGSVVVSLRITAERDTPCRQARDGEQEVGGLRGIGTVAGEL